MHLKSRYNHLINKIRFDSRTGDSDRLISRSNFSPVFYRTGVPLMIYSRTGIGANIGSSISFR